MTVSELLVWALYGYALLMIIGAADYLLERIEREKKIKRESHCKESNKCEKGRRHK